MDTILHYSEDGITTGYSITQGYSINRPIWKKDVGVDRIHPGVFIKSAPTASLLLLCITLIG